MEEIRKKIDGIDSQINKLLDDRADLVREVHKFKKEKNEPVYAPDRESGILRRIIAESGTRGRDGFPVKSKLNIFNEIFSASRLLQKKLTVSFFGPEAT